jgi:SPP1 family predicted phage head-tail adaptor
MGLAAGRLNRRISIEAPVRSPNGQGGFTKGWAPTFDVWAEMIPLRGEEAVQHNLQTSRQLWKVTIRWRAGINEECRAMFNGKPLNIRTCEDPNGRREQLVMTAESGVST